MNASAKPKKKFSYLPDKNDAFQQRENDYGTLKEKINTKGKCAICGPSGIGKSQLAKSYAYENENNYQFMWWFDAQGEMKEQYNTLAKTINRKGLLPNEIIIKENNSLIPDIIEGLNDIKPWLLIFDNAPDYNAIKSWLPKTSQDKQQHIIVTSQNQQWESFDKFYLNVFTPVTAEEYIKNSLNVEDKNENLVKILAKNLGYYPLAISLAIARIKEQGSHYTIKQYIEDLNSQPNVLKSLEVLAAENKPQSLDDYENTVDSIIQLLISKLKNRKENDNNNLLSLVCFIAFSYPAKIPLTAFYAWAEEVKLEQAMLSKFLGILEKNFSIIAYQKFDTEDEIDSSSYFMHDRIHSALFEYVKQQANSYSYADLALKLCSNILEKSIENDSNALQMRIKLAKTAEALYCNAERILNNESRNFPSYILATIKIASLNISLGNLKRARACYENVMTSEYLNNNLLEKALVLDDYGTVLLRSYDNQDKQKAEVAFREALKIREDNLDSNHELIAESYKNLGNFYLKIKNYNEALNYYKIASVKLENKVSSTNVSKRLASIYANVAQVYRDKKEYNDAEYVLKEVIKIKESNNSPDYSLATSLIDLADVQKLLSNQTCIENYKRALALRIKNYGIEHRYTDTVISKLVFIYKDFDLLENGINYINDLHKTYKATPRFLIKLGDYNFQLKQYDACMRCLFEALNVLDRFSADKITNDFAIVYSNIGYFKAKIAAIKKDSEMLKEAVSYSEKSLAIRQKIDAKLAITVGTQLLNIVEAYLSFDDEKYKNFINEYFERAIQIYKDLPENNKSKQRFRNLQNRIDEFNGKIGNIKSITISNHVNIKSIDEENNQLQNLIIKDKQGYGVSLINPSNNLRLN